MKIVMILVIIVTVREIFEEDKNMMKEPSKNINKFVHNHKMRLRKVLSISKGGQLRSQKTRQ